MKEASYTKNWRFVLLTGYHIPFDDRFRERVKAFSDYAQRFLERQYAEAGLMTVELKMHSRKVLIGYGLNARGEMSEDCPIYDDVDRTFYLHAHAICWGERKVKTEFDRDWGETLKRMAKYEDDEIIPVDSINYWAGRWTGLSTVRREKGALRYVLKYIAKGVDIGNDEVKALHRLKTLRTWGELYDVEQPKMEMRCKDCGAKCEVTFVFDAAEVEGLTNDLKIVLVPIEPP